MSVSVWFVRDGPEPTRGGPAYELPLAACAEKLGLAARHWISGIETTPRFEPGSRLGAIAGNRHVVCEIDEAEAAATGWKAGFYRVDVSPQEAVERLGPPRLPWET